MIKSAEINYISIDDELQPLFAEVSLGGAHILDLGCGNASLSRRMALETAAKQVVAIECDRALLAQAARHGLPNLSVAYGEAQSLPYPEEHFDVVTMFKSLHHVPVDCMQRALKECARVLKPSGIFFVLEPVYAGPFNDLVKLFHDEGYVRGKALDNLQWAQENGVFSLKKKKYYRVPVSFASFADFKNKIIYASGNEVYALDGPRYQEIKSCYASHQDSSGRTRFERPISVHILSKV